MKSSGTEHEMTTGASGLFHNGPPIEEAETDPAPPAATEVVVIGGGIVGVSTALALARRGVPVTLCEKGALAAEQSSRNWGWVRNMGRDRRELPLMIEAMRIWSDAERRLGGTGFCRSGILYLCRDERELAARARWLRHARDFQLDTRLIGPDEVARVLPGSSQRWRCPLHAERRSRGAAESGAGLCALGPRARCDHGRKLRRACH